ncbi:putative trehalose-6-phosphate hydrolase [Streptococcus anginosus]|uniref:alpha,alpha-phosphotrehalase n=1 Tax=Streptococcus anginosus TaxID=1328 RepID=UPI0010CAB69C|nr:alpha,alpha-phosphotrehalase [Streptococcus anginosus]VTS24130.1 putative trehalose-6-phosphate hydrolase [Streptococcus anginosus]
MALDKTKVVYQIYPKSFKDTTGNGIGDYQGVIEKIPYLKELGVDMVWLNPFYPSPQRDNGYDISDYTAVNPLFGTMSDFEEMVQVGKEYGIDFMLDMVLNHCSTEHEWFQKALAGDPYYQDFFFCVMSRQIGCLSLAAAPGHLLATLASTTCISLMWTQADLNWRNPHVREELFKVVNFWRNKGVRGFRFDVINLIGKDEVLENCSENDGKPAYTDKPIVHEYLHMMNEATFGQDDSFMTVGEMSATTIENCILYTDPARHELSMAFNFHHLKVDYENGQKWSLKKFDFEELNRLFHTWGKEMSDHDGWSALFWNNHDQPRALNRFVDVQHFRNEGATMLAASIHLSRGMPYIYMGEEIGMVNPDYDSMADYVDVESINAYQMLLEQGKTPEEAFAIIQAKSRDNSRTPMQWDDSANAGFTTGTPWLKAGKSYPEINVENEMQGPIFTFYQKLITLRKELPIIAEGSYQPAYEDSQQVYAFERQLGDEKLLVLNNFYLDPITIDILPEYQNGEVLLSNYEEAQTAEVVTLRPYESLAIIVNKH